jgi:hypothetical protein
MPAKPGAEVAVEGMGFYKYFEGCRPGQCPLHLKIAPLFELSEEFEIRFQCISGIRVTFAAHDHAEHFGKEPIDKSL